MVGKISEFLCKHTVSGEEKWEMSSKGREADFF